MNLKKVKAISLFMSSRFSFAVSASIVKVIQNSPFQINFIRAFFITIFLSPFIWKLRKKTSLPQIRFLIIARILCATLGLVCYYYAFQNLPVAKATTLSSIQTILITTFAGLFLHEKVGPARWFYVLLGYTGVWIAVNPTYTGFSFAEGVALLGALLGATVNILSKYLVDKIDPIIIIFYTAVLSMLFLGGLWEGMPFMESNFNFDPWPAMTWNNFLSAFFIVAPLTLYASFSYLKAYCYVDISLLAPYDYSIFVFSVLIGYFAFGEVPAPTTWLGMALIVFSSLMITRHEITTNRSH